jgi:DNA repair protein RecN (Recombination protein N)
LALGERADPSALRDPSAKCTVEAEFALNGRFKEFFSENELDYFDPAIFRREILPNGRSRAFVNDVPTKLETLKVLASALVDVHSQNEQLAVLEDEFQLAVLDTIAQTAPLLEAYRRHFSDYRASMRELAMAEAEKTEARDLDYWEHQYAELERVGMSASDFEALEREFELMNHGELIVTSVSEALDRLSAEEASARASIFKAIASLQRASAYDHEIAQALERLEASSIELDDITRELERKLELGEADPMRLEHLKNRIDSVRQLLFKHRLSGLSELEEFKREIAERLERMRGIDERISLLRSQAGEKRALLLKTGNELSERRKLAIPELLESLLSALKELELERAFFDWKLEARGEPGAWGLDRSEVLFSANPGQSPVPLKKAASGGEISRVMLALKSIVGRYRELPVLVFDEIDTGISGRTATRMAAVLKKMAASGAHIIAITHLPQIASAGNAHFKVEKSVVNGQTRTALRALSHAERIDELARMLSGSELTDAARTQAELLLADSSSATSV